MLEWEILKGLSGLACMAGAWVTYRTMPDIVIQRKMLNCFKLGGLFLTKKGVKGRDVRIFPVINNIFFKQDFTQVVFTVPVGIDPDNLMKNEWIFQQTFGENIDLCGSLRSFTLKIHPSAIKAFDYNYNDLTDAIKGMKLPIVVGKSREGWEVYDMCEHPHLLLAGETGSGKSTELRSILTTLLLTLSPFQLRLYLADLKRSEFHLFKRAAEQVVVDSVSLLRMLYKIKKELLRRGDLLDEAELANITDLPEKDRPPYIILCVDEVALLKKERDCMQIIEEISAIGRALGVFLILSMQRPDAQILDGKLKNNLTVRMAFKHSDEVNSRITLGTGGAEFIKPSEKGRMLFKLNQLKTVQAPFLDLFVAKKLLEPFKKAEAKGEPIDIEGHAVEEETVFGVLG
jgi:S-DNA-T family DNA segregation ATPase FtsK/SpoIIIE